MRCTTAAWHLRDAVYLNARGVSFAILTTGRWDEVASYVEFMGYTQPWYSVRVDAPVGGGMGYITCFLRDGDRVFLTYATTGRGNEPINGSFGMLDMTPYGRGEAWEDNPEGWPEGRRACWYWRSDADGNATWGPTSRPVPQWTRPARHPLETLGRRSPPLRCLRRRRRRPRHDPARWRLAEAITVGGSELGPSRLRAWVPAMRYEWRTGPNGHNRSARPLVGLDVLPEQAIRRAR